MRGALIEDKARVYRYIESKDFTGAERLLRACCRERPSDPELFYLLGQSLGPQGRLEEAAQAFQRVVELQPEAAVGHGSLGSVLLRLGRASEAAHYLGQACRLLPDDEGYSLDLIECLERAGRRQDAFQECHRLLARHPECAQGHFALGSLSFCAQQYAQAIKHYSRALDCSPGFVDAHIGLGKVLTTIGDYERARRHYATALEQRPEHLETLGGLAILHERCGEQEAAYELVRRVAGRGIGSAAIANVYLNICHQFSDCEAAVDYAESTLASLGEDARWERKALHFGLGRRCDKLGRYERAFYHFELANRQFPINYEPATHTDLVSHVIRVFSPSYMMSAARATNCSDRPLFIVGMPRSGTSLMEQVLASHAEVAAGGELEFISDTISLDSGPIGRQGGYPAGVSQLTVAQLDAIAADYHELLEKISPDARRVTDKMPHNFMALGLIAQLFPGARIIHCRRHPLDTCLSIYFQDFTRHHDYAVDLENIGTHYRQYVKLMAHWKNVLDIPMIEIDYEDMVEDQEVTVRRVLEFCGLDWDPACLEFHKSGRRVNTASYSQVTQPVYRRSLERWRHYEAHLDALKAALERDF